MGMEGISLDARLVVPKVLLHSSHETLKAPEGQRIILKGPQHGDCQIRHPAVEAESSHNLHLQSEGDFQ